MCLTNIRCAYFYKTLFVFINTQILTHLNVIAQEIFISQLDSPYLYQGAEAEAPQSLSVLLQLQSARGS